MAPSPPFLLVVALASAPTADSPPLREPPVVSVPFACGRSFPVSQGHQTGSHTKYDAYAWDWRMPEGEPIVAAADGVVRAARGDSTVGGCDTSLAKHANYVVISHDGGFETQYLHLSKVTVAEGQRVARGQLIGYSGRTGWACGAHLHFKVMAPSDAGWNAPSLESRIEGHGDPREGDVVAAPACGPERPHIASLGADGGLPLPVASRGRP